MLIESDTNKHSLRSISNNEESKEMINKEKSLNESKMLKKTILNAKHENL